MHLKTENYIFIANSTCGFADDRLIEAVLGYLPTKKETIRIAMGNLWSKTSVSYDVYYSAIDASLRLHKLSDDLDYYVTNRGDILIYRQNTKYPTPQDVIDSYHRYIGSKEERRGTILHEGEYILLSKKITDSILSMGGYSILSRIGINTSKINYIGSTKNFLTYIIDKDLGLPFDTSEWQDFEVKGVRFHAYTKKFKNLILLEHDEFQLDYIDEIDEFFKEKEKEKDNMLNKKIADSIFADNRVYIDTTQSVPDKLPEITLEDLRIENSVRAEPMIKGTLMVSPGIVRRPTKFQFTQYAGYKQLFQGGYTHENDYNKLANKPSINGAEFITMPRGLGRTAAMSMLNSFYGINPAGFKFKKPPFKFKLIFGQEHATGRYKTICLWEDGEKTIICGDNKVTKLPVAQAFAWCYVKRTFRSVSKFKKHVDKRTTKMDGIWYFEGDCIVDEYAQGSVPGTSKKRDIYDAAALAIVTKRYGGLRRLVDEYINKEDE